MLGSAFYVPARYRNPNIEALEATASKIGSALEAYRVKCGRYPSSFKEFEEWARHDPDVDKLNVSGWHYRVLRTGDIEIDYGDYVDYGWCVVWNSKKGVGHRIGWAAERGL